MSRGAPGRAGHASSSSGPANRAAVSARGAASAAGRPRARKPSSCSVDAPVRAPCADVFSVQGRGSPHGAWPVQALRLRRTSGLRRPLSGTTLSKLPARSKPAATYPQRTWQQSAVLARDKLPDVYGPRLPTTAGACLEHGHANFVSSERSADQAGVAPSGAGLPARGRTEAAMPRRRPRRRAPYAQRWSVRHCAGRTRPAGRRAARIRARRAGSCRPQASRSHRLTAAQLRDGDVRSEQHTKMQWVLRVCDQRVCPANNRAVHVSMDE